MIEKRCAQANVLDGTVYATDPRPGGGVYVTIAGRDGRVFIVAFSLDDLAVLHRAAQCATDPGNAGRSQEELARITAAGLPAIAEMLGGGL